MYPLIPWEVVADTLESAEHILGTTELPECKIIPHEQNNSSSGTQENTNRPIIWTQITRYCVHRIPQLVLILSQINLVHAFPTYLRYLHPYYSTRHAVYAQPLIMFTNTMFDADISKTCKQS